MRTDEIREGAYVTPKGRGHYPVLYEIEEIQEKPREVALLRNCKVPAEDSIGRFGTMPVPIRDVARQYRLVVPEPVLEDLLAA